MGGGGEEGVRRVAAAGPFGKDDDDNGEIAGRRRRRRRREEGREGGRRRGGEEAGKGKEARKKRPDNSASFPYTSSLPLSSPPHTVRSAGLPFHVRPGQGRPGQARLGQARQPRMCGATRRSSRPTQPAHWSHKWRPRRRRLVRTEGIKKKGAKKKKKRNPPWLAYTTPVSLPPSPLRGNDNLLYS